jgi:3-phytase
VALLDLSSGEGYLFVSVQGNNSYAIFDRKTLELIALFQITKGNIIGGVEETDGIEIINQDKFSYFIAQDGINEGHQNFKFVKLDEIISKIR